MRRILSGERKVGLGASTLARRNRQDDIDMAGVTAVHALVLSLPIYVLRHAATPSRAAIPVVWLVGQAVRSVPCLRTRASGMSWHNAGGSRLNSVVKKVQCPLLEDSGNLG